MRELTPGAPLGDGDDAEAGVRLDGAEQDATAMATVLVILFDDLTSAASAYLFGNGDVIVIGTAQCLTHPLGQFVRRPQPRRLDHAPLGVQPSGLDRVQPRTLAR